MINKIKTIHKGFSLVEVIVAIFIMTIGLVGVYTAIQSISNLAKDSNKRLQASFLALEGVEIIRNIRDNNYKKHDQFEPERPWDKDLIDQGPALFQVEYDKAELDRYVLNDKCNGDLTFLQKILSPTEQMNTERISCFNSLYNDQTLKWLAVATSSDGLAQVYRLTDTSFGGFKRLVLVAPGNHISTFSGMGASGRVMKTTSLVLWKYNGSIRWVAVDTLLFDWQDDISNNI